MDEQSKSQTSCRKSRYVGSTCPVSVLSLVLCVALFIRVEFLQNEVVVMREGTIRQNDDDTQHNARQKVKDTTVKLVQRSESLIRNRRNVPTSTQTPAVTMEQVRAEINKSVKSIIVSKEFGPLIYMQGPRGIPGIPGRDGKHGRRGRRGVKGSRGKMGPPGPVGKHGPQEARGRPGIKGIKGNTGVPGIRGLQGPKGVQGVKGETGESVSVPRVIVTPANLTVNEGVTASFHCTAHATPLPTVTWSRNNGNFSRRVVVDSSGKLQIRNASLYDMGEFTCTAINLLGTASVTASLFVNGPSRFSSPPKSYHTGYVAMDTIMRCDVIGFPRPTVQWRRFPGQMPVGSFVAQNHSLIIKNTKKRDRGAYICRARNKFGGVMTVIILEVKSVRRRCSDPGYPQYGFRAGDKFWEGETVTYHCNAGYLLIGSLNRTCNSSGSWDGQLPRCQLYDSFPECRNYKLLTDADRRDSYVMTGNAKCDKGITPGWYRFGGAAGTRMSDSCVPYHRCNTVASGWFSGGHPAVDDGVVTRRVCFSFTNNCCQWRTSVRIRNCGSFYVYRLGKPSHCYLRYCGTG